MNPLDVSKLVYMANQIGKAFAYQDEAASVASIAGHLRSFWDPRMRKAIAAHAQAGGAGLDPRALAAVRSLKVAD